MIIHEIGSSVKHRTIVLEAALILGSPCINRLDVWHPLPSLLNYMSSPFIVILHKHHLTLRSHALVHIFAHAMALLLVLILHLPPLHSSLFFRGYEFSLGDEEQFSL